MGSGNREGSIKVMNMFLLYKFIDQNLTTLHCQV